VLTGFLDGTRLTTSGLLTCRNAFVKVRAPGSREFTFEDMLSDLNRFRSFITTTIKLLACLGLHADSLMALIDLATAIQEALPTSTAVTTAPAFLEIVIPPSLNEFLEQYGATVKAWFATRSAAPLGPLMSFNT
jgi:hypothetical protein